MATKKIDFLLNVKGNAAAELSKLEQATDKTVRGMGRLSAKTEEAGGKLASLGGVIGGIPIPGFEGLGRAVTAAGDSIEGLSHPMSASIILIGGWAAVTATATAGLVALTLKASDWYDQLVEINAAGGLLTQDQVASIQDAAHSADALGASTKRLAVLLGAELAPALDSVLMGMISVVGAGEDLLKILNEQNQTIPALGAALFGIPPAVFNIADAFDSLGLNSRALGIDWSWLTGRGEKLRDTMMEVADASGKIDIYGPTQEQAGIRGGGKSGPPASASSVSLGTGGIGPFSKAITELPAAIAMEDLTVSPTAKSLQPMIDAQDKASEAFMSGLASATMGTESLVRAIPVVGNMAADLGKAVLNLPSLVNGVRKDLIKGPAMLGEAFEKTITTAIPKLIEAIPLILENVITKLPPAIARGILIGIPKIVIAIAKAIGEAIKNALNFLKGGEDRNILTGKRGKWLGTSFEKGNFSLFGLGNKKGDSLKGGFATGGFVNETGPYMLHAGERVVPPTGAGTGTARRKIMEGGSGLMVGTMNVTVQTNDARDLIRQLRRHLGDLGDGATLTPRTA